MSLGDRTCQVLPCRKQENLHEPLYSDKTFCPLYELISVLINILYKSHKSSDEQPFGAYLLENMTRNKQH